ncbi:Ribonuclease pancreatic [Acipenser ruthenus]|uniref:Ribonuclease pancreatic n=1 Tax=Acipenser ruthenus TaxID=7906 RepID=A0A444UYP4_ACIRT|nr:Ribonuclease pancreatic [Acipenser ruthenus]
MVKFLFLMFLVESSNQFMRSQTLSSRTPKTCAVLHSENEKQLELPSFRDKTQVGSRWNGTFGFFTVMEGCLLTLWQDHRGQGDPQSFMSGAYPSVTGSFSAFLCSCVGEESGIEGLTSTFADFRKRHLAPKNAKGDNNFCTAQIRNRNLTDHGSCKQRNTFVFSDEDVVINVCRTGGSHYPDKRHNNLYKSNDLFNLTECSWTNEPEEPPNCSYTADMKTRFIILACRKKLPVHFQKSVPN